MKLLKNGFAFVIAAVTISLTIAAHAGAFKANVKKATANSNCVPNHPTLPGNQLANSVVNVDDCNNPAAPCPVPNGTILYGIDGGPIYAPLECPPIGTEFCCSKFEANDDCPGQDRVIRIVCGDDEF